MSVDSFNASADEVAVLTGDHNVKEIKEQVIGNLSDVSQLVNGGTGSSTQISVTPEPTRLRLNALNILVWGGDKLKEHGGLHKGEPLSSDGTGVQSSRAEPLL